MDEKAIVDAGVSKVPAALAAAETPVVRHRQRLFADLTAEMRLTTRMGAATNVGVIASGFLYTSPLWHFE